MDSKSKLAFENIVPSMDPAEMYDVYGFAVVKVFDENQVALLERFAKDWLYRLLIKWTTRKEDSMQLDTYHIWSKSLSVDHDSVFRASNRHISPNVAIEDVLLGNARIQGFLNRIGLESHRVWDEGLGWLAFRFVRPGAGDGYPFTRKAWGVAKKVVSCWVPVIGYSPSETLTLVPKSHLEEYEKYLPTDGKFRRDEYRLANLTSDLEIYNPSLERGEAIFYHPRTLHSEDVVDSSVTRLSLEFRFDPVESTAELPRR